MKCTHGEGRFRPHKEGDRTGEPISGAQCNEPATRTEMLQDPASVAQTRVEFVERESRPGAVRGWRRAMGTLRIVGTEFSSGRWKRAGDGWSHNAVGALSVSEPCT